VLVLIAGLAALAAHADIYRWVDRQTGSVKFSNMPPPWYGDAEKEKNAPAVEVLRYRTPGTPPKPTAESEGAAAMARALAALEARWLELNRFFASLPTTTDFSRAGEGLRQHIDTYQAVSAELDRLDPAGAARRRAQDATIPQTIRSGLEAQFSSKPPVR
jgi:hypothetical protein